MPSYIILAVAFALGLTQAAAAQSLTFMTWNIDGGERSASDLEQSAKSAAGEVGPVDVVMLQEVTSEDQVAAIAKGFGMDHYAVSDFAPPVAITGFWAASLEVAVISRIPIKSAFEWDLTGREPHGDDFHPKTSSNQTATGSLVINAAFEGSRASRGFLRVELDLGWSVYSVHWKSSRGASCNAADIRNAKLREGQARGVAQDAAKQLSSGRTVVVGGDLNIQAPGRVHRVGTNASVDCAPSDGCNGICGAGARDGYDDSIHFLEAMGGAPRLLSSGLAETYIDQVYPGGAIDHILVAGPGNIAFSPATTPSVSGNRWFGSDHRPVLTTVSVDHEDRTNRIYELLEQIRDRMSEIERLLEGG